jgi:WD40 repeat protein
VSIPGTAQVLGTSPDGKTLGVGTGQGLVVLSLGGQPRILFSKAFEGGVNGVAFGPGGLIAAAGGDASVRVLDRDGTLLSRMTGHAGPVADVTFLGRDRVVTTGVDGSTRAWAWEYGYAPAVHSSPLPEVGGVAFVVDKVNIVAGDGSTSLWTPPSATAESQLPALPAGAATAAVSGDGRLIATAATDGSMVVRDRSGNQVGSWSFGVQPAQLAWLPGDRGIAAALIGGDVATVDVGASGSDPKVIGKHAEDALAVTARPGDGVVASGGRDGVIRLWDGTPDGRLVADLDAQINALAFTGDGRWLAAAAGDETVRVYDTVGQEAQTTLRGRFGASVTLAFAEGGELVTGSDRGLRIWDWRRGVILLTVPLEKGVRFLAVTGAEPRVASYGFDDVVRLTTCDVCGSIDGVETLLPERTTRTLTAEERDDFQVDG